jgi:hypothetical protein
LSFYDDLGMEAIHAAAITKAKAAPMAPPKGVISPRLGKTMGNNAIAKEKPPK